MNMGCPHNIKENFRRELYDAWECHCLGEVDQKTGKKIGKRVLTEMVRKAEWIDLSGSDPLTQRLKKTLDDNLKKHHVVWL